MLGTLTPAEDGILDKAILDTYALKGITLQTADPSKMEPPTMHELVDVLMTTQGGENMAQTLKKYTDGSYAGLFDKQTNVELSNQMIVFQIRDLEEQLRPIAMYVILNFLWNRIRAEPKRRFLVIDEAWNLLQHDDSALPLRAHQARPQVLPRHHHDHAGRGGLRGLSLRKTDHHQRRAADPPQAICFGGGQLTKTLLPHGRREVPCFSTPMWDRAFFFAGNKHVAIQIVASPEEQRIITTKPEEVLALKAGKKSKLRQKNWRRRSIKSRPNSSEDSVRTRTASSRDGHRD